LNLLQSCNGSSAAAERFWKSHFTVRIVLMKREVRDHFAEVVLSKHDEHYPAGYLCNTYISVSCGYCPTFIISIFIFEGGVI